MIASNRTITAWILLLLALGVSSLAGLRPSGSGGTFFGGGGGSPDLPPPAGLNLGVYSPAPTLVHVYSQMSSGPWYVQVRSAGGAVVDSGTTGSNGEVVFDLPAAGGMAMDVLGTDALDVPVSCGQSIQVWVE